MNKEWIEVLWSGGFFAVVMAGFYAYKRHSAALKPTWRIVDMSSCALMGVWYGIGLTFGRRALHPPLVFVMAAPFVAIAVLLVRRKWLRRKIRAIV